MTITRRIFISSPADKHLDERRLKVKRAIMNNIARLGYEVQAFGTKNRGLGSAKNEPWNADKVAEVMRQCVGAAILGFPRWTFSRKGKTFSLASEYCHYESALARAFHLPLLSVLEEGVAEEGFFGPKSGVNCMMPADADESWVEESDFQESLEDWRRELEDRRDVFLAYSSASEKVALKVKQYLEDVLRVTVLDWHDFKRSHDILDQIAEAAQRCSAGVFLFMKDDKLNEEGQDVPRDNVVFEAGFFASAKTMVRVLIIREEGSKMPADLGGKIYGSLADRENIAPVEPDIAKFISEL